MTKFLVVVSTLEDRMLLSKQKLHISDLTL